ncbi:MAG TPA: efflux RND transporter periplasmic adaptor subunit [Candidatus Acidoferrales bacterium]|nr:efflux RND transporter periplasmic adaptor subunit [Candidatus Acidoferrales bacterium]
MRFGPTSLRLNSILAQGLHRPKLRPDLRVSEQTFAGETTYVINIVESGFYARYSAYEYELLKLCDGTRTVAELAAALSERHPDIPAREEEVAEFLENMDRNIWERSLGEKNLAILGRIRDERKQRLQRSSLLYIYFSAWNPDKLLERIHPYLRWMYTRTFVILSLLLFLSTAIIVAADWLRIRQDTIEFYTFTNKTGYDLWVFWFLLFFTSFAHEFGHGLTCKHYGGRVPQMGFLLIYFTPAFYTECTELVMFDRSSKRLWTIFAGIWIELVICGVATLVWFFSPPGSFVGDLGYKTLLLTGVSGVFINLNPLIKFDGYHLLAEYLQIDSLREDSFEYLKAWARRTLLRQEMDLPPVTRRKQRIFLVFATAALAYALLLAVIITTFVNNIFTSKFGTWGYALTAGLIYLVLRSRLKKWAPAVGEVLRDTKEKIMQWRLTRLQKAGAAAVLVLLFVPPTAVKVSSEFLLEPGARFEVRAAVPGRVAEVRVREGDMVSAGAVLAVLSNPAIEVRAAVLANELALAERALGAARVQSELGEIQKYSRERARLQAELAEAVTKRAGLILRTPLEGMVTTAQVEQRLGDYLEEGEELATVADLRAMRARILVRDWELEDVFVGTKVKLKLRSYPFRSFTGRVRQIMPAAATDRPVAEPMKLERKGQELTNYFAVVMEFENPETLLREGMTGTAKVYGRRYPIAWRVGRSAWRWVRSQVW